MAAALILMVLAAAGIGFASGNRHKAAELASRTDRHDTDGAYENSLRSFAALLDNLSAIDASDAAPQVHGADKALLLMRLADLAEQRGSSAESTRLTSDALAVCATNGLSYCSSVELRERANRLDAVLQSIQQSH